jgi:hypothetical protein
MFDSNEEQLVVETQEIHEKQITVKFDVPKIQGAPWIRALIMRQLGFDVVTIIGVSHDEAQTRDIVVELMHNMFCIGAQVWVKMQDGARRWVSSARF